MFQRILLATDRSPHAMKPLEYARDLTLECDGKVIVLHAFTPLRAADPLGEPLLEQRIEERMVPARELAAAAADDLEKAGVAVDIEVLAGPAADAILRVADTRQCDRITKGCRGHGRLASVVLGSVSNDVVARAHVPVLVLSAWES